MGQRKRRADGLLEKKRTINGKVMHFYGHTVAEIEAKIDAYKAELARRKPRARSLKSSMTPGWSFAARRSSPPRCTALRRPAPIRGPSGRATG